ncbi:MAG: hypothetical protein IT359_16290 [Gemmatimonadaceae bacterium]|nr:hypothetical protein [Gemmatimonadaceae bacterium]
MRSTPYVLVVTLLLTAACSSDDGAGPTPTIRRGIQFVSGNQVTDSVGTQLSAPSIVEVRDSSGNVAPSGTVVRFESITLPGTQLAAWVAPLTSTIYANFASGLTDASGRKGAFVMLPTIPGQLRLVVRVPTIGLVDTARFTAVPGGVASIELAPRDTAILPTKSFTIRATIRDRHSNVLTNPPAFALVGAPAGASVSAAGVVASSTVGLYRVVASVGGVNDTLQFATIPEATIVAHNTSRGEIITISLDGSNRRVLAIASDGGLGLRPRWLPGSSTVIYSGYVNPFYTILLVDSLSAPRHLFATLPPSLSHMVGVAPSPDGQWVYFAGYDAKCATDEYCLHRVHPDGTGVMVIGAAALRGDQTMFPSLSPDGRRVALNTVSSGYERLRVIDLATDAFLPIDVPGAYPQWSPKGNTIAYIEGDGSLALVNLDGSGYRRLVEGAGAIYGRSFTWSPDGAWILYKRGERLTLVDAQTGTAIPIAALRGLDEPSWR